MENEKSGAERRRAKRIKGTFVEYSQEEEGLLENTAFLKDLSLTGVCIFIAENIAEGAVLRLNVHLTGSDSPVVAKGKIVWKSKSGYLNYFNLGIEFIDLDDGNKQRLEEYIKLFEEATKSE